jgi:hypothetical protein
MKRLVDRRSARSSLGSVWAAFFVAASLCHATGCSDDEDAGCSQLAVSCTISQTSCQRVIFAATACQRGQSGAHMPSIRALTRAQYAEELRAEASDEDDFGALAWGRALGLLGLVPREQSLEEASIAEQVSSVAAFYSRGTRQVTIIVDSERDAYSNTLVLSHEFVHALQDQREDLDGFFDSYADTSDASSALKCLVEGEAVLLSNLVMLEVNGFDSRDALWNRYFGEWLGNTLREIERSSAPLFAARSLVYPVGGLALARAYLRDGAPAIGGFYERPYLSFRSWAEVNRGAREPAALDCEPPPPPDGFEQRFLDRQGMIGLLSLYVALGDPNPYHAARGWVSDQFAVYTPIEEDSQDVGVAWRIRLETEAEAERLLALIAGLSSSLSAQQDGADVLLLAASSEELLAAWSPDASCSNTDKARSDPGGRYRAPAGGGRWSDMHSPHRPRRALAAHSAPK